MTNESDPQKSRYTWVIAMLLAIVIAALLWDPGQPGAPTKPPTKPNSEEASSIEPDEIQKSAAELLAEQARLDQSLWADEVAAQKHEQPFVKLWDRLRNADNPWETLASFEFDSITFPRRTETRDEGFGLKSTRYEPRTNRVARAEAQSWIRGLQGKGFRLEQSEWHHARFERQTNGPARSQFNVTLHVAGPEQRRIVFKGKIDVTWQPSTDPEREPRVADIHISQLDSLERSGKPAFSEQTLPLTNIRVALPVIARDLDNDRRSEIIVPAHNVILWNKGDFKFERATLMELYPEDLTTEQMMIASGKMAAVMDEFTGDQLVDLVVALPPHGVFLYAMQTNGRYSAPPRRILSPDAELRFPSVITSGDINGDGRTDLWIGQYKESLFAGELPDPIFDANSGYPAFLLINEGEGRFADRTEAAGLGARRRRWTYSASFWDFDTDGDLDLITVNDYSGVDAYANDGKGNFTTVTETFVDERSNFGMGHAIVDLNRDDRMDFFVTGMSSTTARRLEALGLGREEFPEIQRLRMKMAYGNRVYFGRGQGRFRQPDGIKDQLARTGWSWGVGVLDFANDGWPDLYIANGHISKQTCRDYCTRFWTHDIYLDSSKPKELRSTVMKEIDKAWIGSGASWNGFEKNVLFLNRGGKRFISAAYPMGIAFEYDSRAVLVDDFDLDGRQDLLVGQLDSTGERPFESLHLYRNQWEDNGNCIGFCLRPKAGQSVIGTRIVIQTTSGQQSTVLVNGDSFYAQHSATRLFGIGKDVHVRSAEIIWPDGTRRVLKHPRINQYHVVASE